MFAFKLQLDKRHLADHCFRRFFLDLNQHPDVTVEDLFRPSFWAEAVRGRWAGAAEAGGQVLRQDDMIRVLRDGPGGFDFDLTVKGVSAGGATMGIHDPSGGPNIRAVAARVKAEERAKELTAAMQIIGGGLQ